MHKMNINYQLISISGYRSHNMCVKESYIMKMCYNITPTAKCLDMYNVPKISMIDGPKHIVSS